ncbi:TPA: hypothetical protein L5627_000737 [Pseudomonas aeruginosa]|nr:hypothetical protein DY961_23535 [Pseudomonas aeruginosa]TEE03790.1 hypothetical protein IPC1507_09615 [Pseudomonas aeruginosa]TEE11784.1 hypothetical protein IPC1506_16035 [Pseudomonas aeruginosa]TEE26958.1 hypothetical protein IPC1505_05610 [Pseudomonas aeruginosa]TEE49499.1 hypothetical protein IPC1502_09525 [Pseudomonas aeruginosa]
MLYQAELSNREAALRHSRMTVVVAGGMHDADTRGGLGHRRDWSPDPSACMGDAVEMDIASGVPGFYR